MTELKKYRVDYETVASFTTTVEAESAEDALLVAEDVVEFPSLCAHCSGWGREWELDLGDGWGLSTDSDGKSVAYEVER